MASSMPRSQSLEIHVSSSRGGQAECRCLEGDVAACLDFRVRLPAQSPIPPVLNSVVRSPRQQLGDFRPARAQRRVRSKDDRILLLAPRVMADAGVDLIAPAQPALLARTTWHRLRDGGPTLRPEGFDCTQQHRVFLARPGAAELPSLSPQASERECARLLKECSRSKAARACSVMVWKWSILTVVLRMLI